MSHKCHPVALSGSLGYLLKDMCGKKKNPNSKGLTIGGQIRFRPSDMRVSYILYVVHCFSPQHL